MRVPLLRVLGLIALLSLLFTTVSAAPAGPEHPGETATKGNVLPGQGLVIEPADAAGPAHYIVQLAEPPAASYAGGLDGLPATSPSATGAARLEADDSAVQAYVNYLWSRQDQVLLDIESSLGRPVEVYQRYEYAFDGFAVQMLPEEAAHVATLPGVRQVQRNLLRQLLTDYGPAWLGAPGIWDGTATGGLPGSSGEGVIVGVIDSGINLDSPAFADIGGDGFGHTNPLGAGNYLGWCNPSHPRYDPGLACNDKLIGVYSYPASGNNPEDDNGHGSHTASTAAGNAVVDATLDAPTIVYSATISGVAPHANIIAYDACASTGCPLTDLLAAIDQAVADGVDVINYSIGGASSNPWSDSDAQAFLNAASAGVIPVTSAGNAGPGPGTVGSPADAPWIISVGASTHNRKPANALVDLSGGSNPPPADMAGKSITAGYGPAAIVYAGDYGDQLCARPFAAGAFSGQIVVCDRGDVARMTKGGNVLAGGAGGLILANDEANGNSLNADPHVLPAVHISYAAGQALKTWLASGRGTTLAPDSHTGRIAGTSMDVAGANGDIMAAFSSRGPNPAVANVVKPDVTAPGVDILAAYKTGYLNPGDPTTLGEEFWVISGTSMSSPHVAGAAALLRALHPDWSVAEIKSALMATARTLILKEDEATPADPFDMGAGHVDLSQAGRAGLLLDETTANFLAANPASGGDPRTLNLASLADNACNGSCAWTRSVRNAGGAAATWNGSYSGPGAATLTPATLDLAAGASASFQLNLAASGLAADAWYFGQVTWQDAAGQLPDMHLPVAFYVVDFAPDIRLTPDALASTQPPGRQTNRALSVENDGEADLTWNIVEEPIALAAGPGDVCDAPADVAWLSVTPASGTTRPGANSAVQVAFDSAGLDTGVYEATLCVNSNDPDEPLLAVPVMLSVELQGVGFCPAGQAPVPLYFSELEADNGGWQIGGYGDWEWGAPVPGVHDGCNSTPGTEPAGAYSGSKVWANNLNGCYANAGAESLLISRTFDFSSLTAPIRLSWWNWYEIFYSFDKGEVYVNGDLVWEITTSAATPGWTKETVDLSAYAGQAEVEVIFRLYASTVVNRLGWYVDDIAVEHCTEQDIVSIDLSKTVGTDLRVCSASDEIWVRRGDEVTYCFQVTNTGTISLTLHDLADSHLGTLLDDFEYPLLPSASLQLTRSAILTATTVNQATWTAFNPGPVDMISSSATATVTVRSAGDFCPAGPELGQLDSADPTFNRPYVEPGGACAPSSVGTNVHYDVHSYNLVGPEPHALLASLCSPNGSAGFDSVLAAYRAPEGSEKPFSPAQPCTNLLAYSDDICGVQAQVSLAGLDEGWLDVVVTSFGNNVTGDYTLFAESATCSATLPPDIAVAPASVAVTAKAGQPVTRTLTISNAGEADLVWDIAEDGTTPQKRSPATSGGDPRLAVETLDDLAAASGPSHNAPAGVSAGSAVFAWPEALLYGNGPLVNGPGTGAGGADEAILQNVSLGMSGVGFGHQAAAGNRVADDFTIADAEGWTIERITFFAYQTGAPIAPSTLVSASLRIWDGPPGQPGSNVLFGDTQTNRMTASTWAGVYRVTENSSGVAIDRPVMANVVAVDAFLPAGTYWLDWQAGGSLASGPWAVPINISGQAATGNALQFTGAWNPALDAGSSARQGFPFLIEGHRGNVPEPCSLGAADMGWLTVQPLSGATAGGLTSPVDLVFQADGLTGGAYGGNLCITSNDPDEPLVIVSVTMTVSYDLYLPLFLMP